MAGKDTTPLLAGSNVPEPSRFDKAFRQVKCVVVGDGAVGKTCMLISYTTNTFPKDYVPTIFDNFFTNVMVDGKVVNFHLWDTAGQGEWDKLRYLAYPETDCFILCYDISSKDSLANLKQKWMPEITQHRPGVPYVVVGTKRDLRTPESKKPPPPGTPADSKDKNKTGLLGRLKGKNSSAEEKKDENKPTSLESDLKLIPEAEGRRVAVEIGATEYMECSALTQESLRVVFDQVIRMGLNHKYKTQPTKKCCLIL